MRQGESKNIGVCSGVGYWILEWWMLLFCVWVIWVGQDRHLVSLGVFALLLVVWGRIWLLCVVYDVVHFHIVVNGTGMSV